MSFLDRFSGKERGNRDVLREIARITGDSEFLKHGDQVDMIKIGRNLAEYLHENHVNRIVFLDTSARPAYICLSEAWRRMYPEEKLPEIYFINPKGFNSSDSMFSHVFVPDMGMVPRIVILALKQIPSELPDFVKRSLLVENQYDLLQKTNGRDGEIVSQQFRENYKKIIKDTESPVLIFDTCCHTGMSYDLVLEEFQKQGFQDVRVGLASNSNNFSGISPDFVALQGEAVQKCYPFDHESLVQKTIEDVTSSKIDKDDPQRKKLREKGIKLRAAIKKLFDLNWTT